MPRNLQNRERVIRLFVIAPAALIAALLVGLGSTLAVVLLVVAALMVATGAVSFCPLYAAARRLRRNRREPLIQ